MTRNRGYGRPLACSAEAEHYDEVMRRPEPKPKLDPRCNATLYEDLLQAAKLVQQNEYEKAREAALSAFGVVHGIV